MARHFSAAVAAALLAAVLVLPADADAARAVPHAKDSNARKAHCRHKSRGKAKRRGARGCRTSPAIQMPEASPPPPAMPPPPAEEVIEPPATTPPPAGGSRTETEPPVDEPQPETETPLEPETDAASHFRFFSPSSFWNTETSVTEPLDTASTALMANFNAEVDAEIAAEKGPSLNAERWSIPVYTVAADQPLVKVKQDGETAAPLQAAWSKVPVPPDAVGAAGTDKHLVVWQPSTDKLWEFWHFEGSAGHFTAHWGGAMEHVSQNPGVYGPAAWPGATYGWGASATSLSIAGGLITIEDLERGEINHALALGIPQVRAGVFTTPAYRGDGTSLNPLSLPEGAHLRLDPKLDLESLHLPHFTYMLAKAAQRYGIYVRSRAGVIAFFGQDPTPTGTNPYHGPNGAGVFEGRNRLELLSAFPWSHLQLTQMALFPDP